MAAMDTTFRKAPWRATENAFWIPAGTWGPGQQPLVRDSSMRPDHSFNMKLSSGLVSSRFYLKAALYKFA